MWMSLFIQTTLDFVGRSAAMGIQIMTSESFVNDPKQQVRNLKASRSIFIIIH